MGRGGSPIHHLHDRAKGFSLADPLTQREDSFIDSFWKVRNPDPGSATNTYKEEHYRRLAYVNDTFGDPGSEDGWRTERGRMYIILGPPKQRAQYHDVGNVLPMEIWFYEADTPALPPYFYLLFYRPSPYRGFPPLFPAVDTPVKLLLNRREPQRSRNGSQDHPRFAGRRSSPDNNHFAAE
ncbi:MAG: GWxTD domain-containing protein [Terracidiphilus sp.]